MTSAFDRNVNRACSHCGRDLTDPASEERGVGPACGKKNAALFARGIPAKWVLVYAITSTFDVSRMPIDLQARFEAFKLSVEKRLIASSQETTFHVVDRAGADNRALVKEIDFFLSFRLELELRTSLINIVKYLGYQELAAVLSQEASMSEAYVTFHEGSLSIKGKRCKAGTRAMLKINGVRWTRGYDNSSLFVGKGAASAQMLEVIKNHWPFYVIVDQASKPIEGATMETLRAQAEEWVVNNPPVRPTVTTTTTTTTVQSYLPTAMTPSKPEVKLFSIIGRGGVEWLELTLPYVRGNYLAFSKAIEGIKTISPSDRSYNPTSKVWAIKKLHQEKLTSVLSESFKVTS